MTGGPGGLLVSHPFRKNSERMGQPAHRGYQEKRQPYRRWWLGKEQIDGGGQGGGEGVDHAHIDSGGEGLAVGALESM